MFNPRYFSKTEKEIILPNGEVLRPDRVLIEDKKAIIVDFKTGKYQKKHETQVLQYADVLKSMGYSPVHSKLVYLKDRSVLNVESEE